MSDSPALPDLDVKSAGLPSEGVPLHGPAQVSASAITRGYFAETGKLEVEGQWQQRSRPGEGQGQDGLALSIDAFSQPGAGS
jgi:hypothetical protein